MKKLLGILVMGLLLSGCFDQTDKLIERCADHKFEKNGYEFENDPLHLFTAEKPAKEKLENGNYDRMWRFCEEDSTKYPKKFKAQFKD
ncbi:hypothetical protein N9N83_01730 [Candidatus Pelagibacter sp.]|nr:hypothetical protein [Candidatus Pelagibacter sp.]